MARKSHEITAAGVFNQDIHVTEKPSTENIENAGEWKAETPDIRIDWTTAEERAATRKLDWILFPLLGLPFLALQWDRTNIATALSSTITEDLGINTNDINNGNQLLSVGIILLEVPSNVILQRIGPQRWLSGQIFVWGTIALAQTWINSYGSYMATRLLLGLAEAGFIPGALYTMSTYYKRSETNTRVAIFFVFAVLSSATGSLVGAGILTLSGKAGLAGWQWVFLVEGAFTLATGVIFACFIPPDVRNSSPWISFGRWSYFNERETHILTTRVLFDDPTKVHGKVKITRKDMNRVFVLPRLWIHVVITLSAMVPAAALQTYGPKIVKSFGFSAVNANALNAVGFLIAATWLVILGQIADRYKRRGPTIAFAAVWLIISYSCLFATPPTANKWNRYAALTAGMGMNYVPHALNIGWLSCNSLSPAERSLSMALIVMSANAGALAGAQVFRQNDAPYYRNGYTALVVLASFLLTVTVGQIFNYIRLNRQIHKRHQTMEASEQAQDVLGQDTVKREFQW